MLDPEVVRTLVDLNERRGGTLLPAMIDAFLGEECPAILAELRSAAAAGNASSAARAAHKLRGSSASLGAKRLAEVCTRIESAATSGPLSQVDHLLVRLQAELALTERALAPYRSAGSG